MNTERGKVVLSYTMLMAAGQIVAGVVVGFIRMAFGGEASSQHVWGAFDSVLVTRLIGTAVVAYAVYWRLLHKHPQHFLQNGLAIAVLAGLLSLVLQIFQSPGHLSLAIVFFTIVYEVLIFIATRALIWPYRDEISVETKQP